MRKKKQKKVYTMYTLELEDNCYYVGVTKFLSRSMDKHHQGKCSWTKLHRPLRIQESYYINISSENELPLLVKEKASDYARLYGVENVGYWQKIFKEYYIYVLRLEGDNYYIGMTSRLNHRILDHISERGADWTRKHKPIKLIEKTRFLSDDINYAYRVENIKTFQYMDLYGVEKVRGGTFSSEDFLFKNIISKYKKKYNIPSSVYEEIMSYIKPELVPKNLWGLAHIHKNDLYKSIKSFEEIKNLLININIIIDIWPYTNDPENMMFSCWILRGFSPAFARYYIDNINTIE